MRSTTQVDTITMLKRKLEESKNRKQKIKQDYIQDLMFAEQAISDIELDIEYELNK